MRIGAAMWLLGAIGVGWWAGWLWGLLAACVAVPAAVALWFAAAAIERA